MMEIQAIELSKLHESKTNPRTKFDKTFLAELSASIKEKGVLNPLLVRRNEVGYEIVDGAQRYRSAKAAGLKEVPCIVRVLTDEQVLEMQLIENLQREGLHPLDEAGGLHRLQELGYNIEQIATKVGKQPWYVQRCLKYLDLIEPVKKLFWAREISGNHALLIARLQPEQQKETVPWLKRGDSAAGLKSEIERHFFLVLKDAPFDIKDAKLVPKAGSCVGCPKRTGFNKLLFADIKESDTCTDPACYENKVQAFVKVQILKTHDANPGAILLSIGDKDNSSKMPKGTFDWVIAGDKTCPDIKEGIVVEQLTHWQRETQKATIGQVLKVCVHLKCKTHNPRIVSDYDSSTGGSKTAIKARKLELRRRALIFKELASDSFTTNAKEVLTWLAKGLGHDVAKAVCDSMEWEPKASKYGGKDYQSTVEANISKLTSNGKGIHEWTYLLMLADSELWYPSMATVPKPKLLEAKAKELKVPLAEIAKLAKTKKSAKEPKEKRAKAASA